MHKRATKKSSNALVATSSSNDKVTPQSLIASYEPSMLNSPTISLSGHEGAIYGLAWDPTGDLLASCSYDKQIFLWNIREDCVNYNVLKGHKSGVIQVSWKSDKNRIVSCSADKSVSIWDANKGIRTIKFEGHKGIVNSVTEALNSAEIIASGSDDCSVILWDVRSKSSVHDIFLEYQVTSVCMSNDGTILYAGGIDNIIRSWDIRQLGSGINEPSMILKGCNDTITGLSLSPDGFQLLSNSMDHSLKLWDIRPVSSSSNRLIGQYDGVHHGAEKLLLRCDWSSDGRMISCGSADRMTNVFDSQSKERLHHLPGHKASVNQCVFHPKQKLLASCSSDKTILIGELE